MSDTESSSNSVKPSETYNQAKLRLDKELKALIKTSKGKAGKELVRQKELEIEQELAQLKSRWEAYRRAEAGEDTGAGSGTDDISQGMQQMSLYNARPVELSKQQRKLKARQEREEAEQKALKDSVAHLPDLRKIENEQFSTKLQSFTYNYGPFKPLKGAAVVEIRGDGHCLFRAILDQLTTISKTLAMGSSSQWYSWHSFWLKQVEDDVKEKLLEVYGTNIDTILSNKSTLTVDDDITLLRRLSASYTLLHEDDFAPYLIDDIAFELGGVKAYCSSVTDMKNPIWGGEVELNSLSHVFKVGIYIVNTHQDIFIGQEYAQNSDAGALYLSYHKYYSSAGEHYNALEPLAS